MDQERIFHIKYPAREFIAVIFVLLTLPVLLFLIPGNPIIIAWVVFAAVFLGYGLLKLMLTNILGRSYILLNKEGITIADHLGKIKKYSWNDYKGHILIENMIMIQFGKKNIKIHDANLKNGSINDIIKIVEENKADVKYDNDEHKKTQRKF